MLRKVILYNVRRNLNRAVRTCFSFGIDKLIIVKNPFESSIQWELKGNLYSAKNNVKIIICDMLPDLSNAVALENYYSTPIEEIEWTNVDTLIIGGESKGLPKTIVPRFKAKITTVNKFCLTVEAALAIGLNEWTNKGLHVNKM